MKDVAVFLYSFRCPQWSEDEQLCARNVTNEVHFFDGGLPGVIMGGTGHEKMLLVVNAITSVQL